MTKLIYRLLILLIFTMPGCSALPQFISTNPQSNILTAKEYPNLLVEVMYIGSFNKPTKADLDYLKTKIKQYCHKETVEIVVDPEICYSALPSLIWSTSLLSFFEFKHARFTTVGDTLVVRVLYVPGLNGSDLIVRGLAYGDYAFVLFKQQIPQGHDRSVLLHEFGHLIGLVNCGTPCQTNHEERDPKHRLHCQNEKCVMYWCSPEGAFPDFDAACRLDITANGGK